MSTRREFLTQTTTALVAATSIQLASPTNQKAVPKPLNGAPNVMRQAGSPIKKVICREETTLRLGGHGAEWHMSWAADDRQFVSLGGGMGWSDNPERVYISRLLAISNGPHDAIFQDVPAYPDHLQPASGENAPPVYTSFGTFALDGRIYQFLNTLEQGTPSTRTRNFIGTKLIYSPDNGRTWCNQDGSTPVTWEGWDNRSRKSMLFFEEPQNSFSVLSVLQMGRNYEANRDGYVYIYSCNGNTEGTMNQLVLCRVPKGRIVDRSAYEFFSGLKSDGSATWSADINARGVVHTFPSGWVNASGVPHAWQPSVAYNAPLGRVHHGQLGQRDCTRRCRVRQALLYRILDSAESLGAVDADSRGYSVDARQRSWLPCLHADHRAEVDRQGWQVFLDRMVGPPAEGQQRGTRAVSERVQTDERPRSNAGHAANHAVLFLQHSTC